ncbi:MAG: hypothetical protein M3R24_20970, partial [Chloroflexota bacterium]|nr:hypothetical protein [Chloroflexota bacterium]
MTLVTNLDIPLTEKLLLACAVWPMLSTDDPRAHVGYLRTLLEQLPAEKQPGGLDLAAVGDEAHVVSLLTQLAPPALPGLGSIALRIGTNWEAQGRADRCAMDFYHALRHYGVDDNDADGRILRVLIAQGNDADAEETLLDLAAKTRTPDVLFALAMTLYRLDRPPQVVLRAFHDFITAAPNDARNGTAWRMVGMLSMALGDFAASLQAYEQAATIEQNTEWQTAFRSGDWQQLDELRSHPDYSFPSVVTLDLEVDPVKDASPGERVFEVAAVRTKGRTVLQEYHSYIRRDFVPKKKDFDLAV